MNHRQNTDSRIYPLERGLNQAVNDFQKEGVEPGSENGSPQEWKNWGKKMKKKWSGK